jgi:uncharacterized membrane protein YcaP (DUF421 family)
MGIILRSALVYSFLLVIVRVVGRRSFEQMTPFEMILIFLLGGIGIQSVVGDDRSLTGALLGISTIAGLHVLVAYLKMRYAAVGRWVDGTPIVIVEDGRWDHERLRRLRLHEQDVMATARQSGIERLEQILFAVVERNGAISIVRKQA